SRQGVGNPSCRRRRGKHRRVARGSSAARYDAGFAADRHDRLHVAVADQSNRPQSRTVHHVGEAAHDGGAINSKREIYRVMQTFRVKAIQTFYWAGRDRAPGEIFDVEESERSQFQIIHDLRGVIEIMANEKPKALVATMTTEFPAAEIVKPALDLPRFIKE